MKFNAYVQELIYGKRQGFFASFGRFILLIFSFFFKMTVKLRNIAYDSGLFSRYRPPVPLLISIGNIVAGGTGKTPATLLIAEEFYEEFKVAILSRGYRSSAEHQQIPLFLSQGKGPLHPASFCGDEPYLIAENLPKAIVIVGKNRHESSNMAAKMGAEVILLDDGMQLRKLARDLEVVLVDAKDPFGQGYFLPRGFLRESAEALRRADLIILNHVQDEEQFLELKSKMQSYSKAEVVGSKMQAVKFLDLQGSEIPSLKDVKIGLFCAIAKPEKFKETALAEGAEIVADYFMQDHLPFDPLELEAFANQCRLKGASIIVCTEKDKVKFPKYLKVSLPIVFVKSRLQLIYGELEWKTFVKNAKKDIMRRI